MYYMMEHRKFRRSSFKDVVSKPIKNKIEQDFASYLQNGEPRAL
jgi:hypothetical protein